MTMLRFEKRVQKLLEGSIDVHIHSAPDIFPRIMNDVDLALSAKQEGMRAILIKSHVVNTADRAEIASQVADFPVFGAIALNLPVGGVNLEAVEVALKMGAKEVWLPTIHASHYVAQKDHVPTLAKALKADVKGINLLKEDGTLKEELYPIFKKIAEFDVALGTGHVTVREAKAVVREASKAGVKKIIVTHPLATFVNYTTEDMKEVLDSGALFLNTSSTTSPARWPFPLLRRRSQRPSGRSGRNISSCPRIRDSGSIRSRPSRWGSTSKTCSISGSRRTMYAGWSRPTPQRCWDWNDDSILNSEHEILLGTV
jgi:hypothetical protein